MMRNKSVQIVCVENSELVYDGLMHWVAEWNRDATIRRIRSFQDMESSLDNTPDICLLNPMLITSHLKDFKQWRKNNPYTSVVAICVHAMSAKVAEEVDFVFSIYDDKQDLLRILHQCLCNKKDGLDVESVSNIVLTEREIEVLENLAAGLSNKEIATKLNISVHTVISHRKNITLKTGIKTEAGLTVFAISKGFLQLDDY